MKRKKIETLQPKQTKKKGEIVTVQELDGILILNFFHDKILESRYCMVTETGEHEYWKPKTGWNVGKLKGCMGAKPNENYWMQTKEVMLGVKFDSKEDEELLKNTGFTTRTWTKDIWYRIEAAEEMYDCEKRWGAEDRRQYRLLELMKKLPSVPGNIADWLFRITGNQEYMFWDKEEKSYGCTSCESVIEEKRLKKENGVKKILDNDTVTCPVCGKKMTVKKRKKRITVKTPFYLIQEAEEEAGAIRFFDAWVEWRYAWKGAYVDEGIRIMAYKPGSKNKSKKRFDIYYKQYQGYKRCGFDRGNNGNRRAKDGILYQGNIQKALEHTVYASAGRLLEQMAAAGTKLNYNDLLIGAYGYVNYVRTVEYLFKGRFKNLLRETVNHTEWWGCAKYYGTLHLDGETAEEVLGLEDRQKINRLRDMDGGQAELEWLRWSDRTGKKLPQQTLEWMTKQSIKPNHLMRSAKHMNPQQIQNYLEKQKQTQYPERTQKEILEQWEDYLQMCEALGKKMDDEMVYRPRELKRRHDEIVQNMDQLRILKSLESDKEGKKQYAQEMREKYPQAESILQDIKSRYEYENEEYRIIVPENLVQIVEEGRALHHCAGSTERYFERIESRETYICFLRRKETPQIPYYTIEVEPSGTIRQHRSYLDEEPGIEEIRGFLREWQQEVRKRLTAEDRRLAKISEVKREKNIEELKQKNNTRVLKALEEDFLENVMEEAV